MLAYNENQKCVISAYHICDKEDVETMKEESPSQSLRQPSTRKNSENRGEKF